MRKVTIFVDGCLTDSKTKELQRFLLAHKPVLNKLWQKESARQDLKNAKRIGLILEAIELCNFDSISPADYTLIASLSHMVDS